MARRVGRGGGGALRSSLYDMATGAAESERASRTVDTRTTRRDRSGDVADARGDRHVLALVAVSRAARISAARWKICAPGRCARQNSGVCP